MDRSATISATIKYPQRIQNQLDEISGIMVSIENRSMNLCGSRPVSEKEKVEPVPNGELEKIFQRLQALSDRLTFVDQVLAQAME